MIDFEFDRNQCCTLQIFGLRRCSQSHWFLSICFNVMDIKSKR